MYCLIEKNENKRKRGRVGSFFYKKHYRMWVHWLATIAVISATLGNPM